MSHNLIPCRFNGTDLITDWEEYFPDYDICECSRGICINPLDTLVYMRIVGNTMVFTPITQHSLSYDVVGDISDNLINIDTLDEGKGNLTLVWEFLTAMAGYCSCTDYEKWFEGSDVELI